MMIRSFRECSIICWLEVCSLRGATFEQVYLILKALTTSNSAKRQGVPDDEIIGILMAELRVVAVFDGDVHYARELVLEQEKDIEDILAKDPKMVDDCANASV